MHFRPNKNNNKYYVIETYLISLNNRIIAHYNESESYFLNKNANYLVYIKNLFIYIILVTIYV